MSQDNPPIIDTEVVVKTGGNRLDTIAERRAKRLLDRVGRGEKLSHAANAERMTLAELQDAESPIRQSLQQLIGGYFLPPEARKQMVRAGLNKLFLGNVNSDDVNQQKLALDAAKQIAADPEVGLQQEAGGGVVINIAELSGVFEQIRATRAPEVSDGRQGDDRPLEAEFEDLPMGGDKSDAVPDVPERRGVGESDEG